MVGARWALCAILSLAQSASVASPSLIDAADYRAFWLWAGVRPQPVLARAERIYLLGGEVGGDPVRLEARRPAPPRGLRAEVWLVVRVESLAWPPVVRGQVFQMLERWRAGGNHLVGLQIDFDARTRHLAEYAAFLRDLRAALPPDTRLGITGLLDWSANGDPRDLNALAGVADEAVLQVYQGQVTIPGYAAYVARLDRMPMPFRIGLVQGGKWRAPASLSHNPHFRGYVVFLVNGR